MKTEKFDELMSLVCDLYDESSDKALKETNENMQYYHIGVVFACETILRKAEDLEYDEIGN